MTAKLISGDRALEPAELEHQVNRAAAALAAEGVGPDESVALLLRNDFPFFVVSLAARRLGAFATPINWHATPEEVGYVLADSGAKLLVGHDDLLAALAGGPAGMTVVAVPTPPEIVAAYNLAPSAAPENALVWDDWLARAPDSIPPEHSAASSPMIYTSGTTGKPKGVRRFRMGPEHAAALQRTVAFAYGLMPGEPMVVMMTGPMYHSAPNSYGLAATALAKTIVLQPRFDVEALLAEVERHRVTHMHMVPTMFVRPLKLPDETRRRHDLSSLRFVVHGAAPCPVDVKRRMIEWWGPVINEYYGSTETGLATAHGSAVALRKPGTVGRALPGVTLRVLGPDGAALPPGEPGDVYIGSDNMPDFTYHGREAEREAAGRDGMVTLGDVGYLDEEGFLFLCDRRRDMMISGGVNIYPAEIEAALLAVDGVRDCAVFGIPDPEFGEAVCAHVELEAGGELDRDRLRAALAPKLSRYKLPKVIEFAEQLPREDSGKIFKRRLRDPYWADVGRSI